MKKLILTSVLLFSFNAWAEILALECKQILALGTPSNIESKDKTELLMLEKEPKFFTINLDKMIWVFGTALQLEIVSDEGIIYRTVKDKRTILNNGFGFEWTVNRLTGEVTSETPVTFVRYACKKVKPLW